MRDSIVLALQYWKGVPGSDIQEPSETVSSVRGELIKWFLSLNLFASFSYLCASYRLIDALSVNLLRNHRKL